MDMRAETEHLDELNVKVENLNHYCTYHIELVKNNCINILRQTGRLDREKLPDSLEVDSNLSNISNDQYGNAKAKQVKKK